MPSRSFDAILLNVFNVKNKTSLATTKPIQSATSAEIHVLHFLFFKINNERGIDN